MRSTPDLRKPRHYGQNGAKVQMWANLHVIRSRRDSGDHGGSPLRTGGDIANLGFGNRPRKDRPTWFERCQPPAWAATWLPSGT